MSEPNIQSASSSESIPGLSPRPHVRLPAGISPGRSAAACLPGGRWHPHRQAAEVTLQAVGTWQGPAQWCHRAPPRRHRGSKWLFIWLRKGERQHFHSPFFIFSRMPILVAIDFLRLGVVTVEPAGSLCIQQGDSHHADSSLGGRVGGGTRHDRQVVGTGLSADKRREGRLPTAEAKASKHGGHLRGGSGCPPGGPARRTLVYVIPCGSGGASACAGGRGVGDGKIWPGAVMHGRHRRQPR